MGGSQNRQEAPEERAKNSAGAAAGINDLSVEEDVERIDIPDPVPDKVTDAWLWLENAKAEKEAQKRHTMEVNGSQMDRPSRSARRRRYKKMKEEEELDDMKNNLIAAS